jgi:acetyl-CoA synthetase
MVVYEPKANWIDDCALSRFLKKTGHASFASLLKKSQDDPEWFWEEALRDIGLSFERPYSKLLAEGLPFPRWAVDARISIVENCIDRHLEKHASKPALIFESDTPGQSTIWTYEDLTRESSYVADLLRQHGANVGDRAALLMPMSLEMVAAFFGILRAGLTVIPIFSGYGADAIASRLNDSQTRFVFVQEKTFRRGKEVPVRSTLEEARRSAPIVEQIFILKREEFLNRSHPGVSQPSSASIESEATCLLLYTSGTTGKPKACVHTPFGVLATTGKELRYSFDVKPSDHFFWYTDIGWMMGPWELFGVLQFGATIVLYEGVPDYPNAERMWQILDQHQVTHFGISPTAVRVLKKSGDALVEKYSLRSLRILGSTGEPWDTESWTWFFEKVGRKKCPIINISGGTEIMGCLLMPTPLSQLKPCTLGGPALGAQVEALDEDGKTLSVGLGHLVCKSPLPSMTKGFLHSRERYLETYFEKFGPEVWYHGDWALIDEDGLWFLRGRSDDTIKIAGKRVGPNEFESALMEDSRVAEVAAVGLPHEIKGEAVYCFVVLKNPSQDASISESLLAIATQKMGKALAPEKICLIEALPKTRSGKILRGVIRKIALGEPADLSSVENLSSLNAIPKLSG